MRADTPYDVRRTPSGGLARLAALALLALHASGALAETPVPPPPDDAPPAPEDVFVHEEVLVIMERDPRSVDAPRASTVVVEGAEIARGSANTAADVLQFVAGLDVEGSPLQRDAGDKVRIRGLDAQYTLVLVDGERVTSKDGKGTFDLSALPAEAIERIEVVKGPGATLAGGDAVGGLVNVVTRRADGSPRLQGTVRYGAYGTMLLSAEAARTMGGADVQVLARREQSDGWSDALDLDRTLRQTSARADARATEKTFLQASGGWRAGADDRLRLKSSVTLVRAHRDQHLAKFTESGDRGGLEDTNRLDVGAGWTRLRTAGGTLDASLGLGGTLGDRGETSTLTLARSGRVVGSETRQVDERIRHWLAGARLEWRRTAGAHGLAASASSRLEHRASTASEHLEAFDAEGRLTQRADFARLDRTYDKEEWFHALALQDEVALHRSWQLSLGLRGDLSSHWGGFLGPSTALAWRPAEAWTLGASAAMGHKMPSFEARTRPATPTLDLDGGRWIQGNPDLRPERSATLELSARHQRGGLAASAALFRTQFWNRIQRVTEEDYLDSGLPLERDQNVGRELRHGLELDARWASRGKRLELAGNVSLLRARDLETGRGIDKVAPALANAMLAVTLPFGGTRLSAAARWVASRPRLDADGFRRVEGPEPQRFTLDGRVAQPLGPNLELFGELFNVLDAAWDRDGDGDTDLPGIHLFVGLRARL